MTSLGSHLGNAESGALLLAPGTALAAADLLAAAPAPALVGATVALRLADPADLVRCLVALDGRAAALLLLAPTLPEAATRELMAATGATILVTDGGDIAGALTPAEALTPGDAPRDATTAWIMTTSGTTGLPKTVRHSLASLARAVRPARADFAPVWGLLYEPSRFAGLQVVLQALLGGGRLAIPAPDAAIGDRLRFLAAAGTTHLSPPPACGASC